MKNSIKENITQVLLIVFSVVLGLYLSERIEDRKNKADSEKLLNNLRVELKSNLLILQDEVPYHQEISQNLSQLVSDEAFIRDFAENKSLLFERMMTRGTMMKQTPTSDAWEIAKANPLFANIEYEKLLVLSRIYNQQERTYELIPDLVDMLLYLNPKDENIEHKLEMLNNQFHELYTREVDLLDYYTNAKDLLELDEVEIEE